MGRLTRKQFSFREAETQNKLNELKGMYVFTAGYCRLSVENEDGNSITNQKAIIENCLAKHPELKLTRFYVDDGVTGTLMDRPEWNRMMREVYAGKVQCIIVKDLSRFGRNYMETGYYAEHIFPKLGLRFISCVDDVDTEVVSDDLPFKIRSLVNDVYARDISRKMSIIFDKLRKSGDLLMNIPYGFKKNGKKMVADPDTAPIVQMIFAWAEMGVGVTEIADRLTLMGVTRPSEQTKGVMDGIAPWSASSVSAILRNHSFTGTYVSGKRIVRMHREMKGDQWVVISGHHEAIITEERFENVQKRLGKVNASNHSFGYHEQLNGKLFCGICNAKLSLVHRKQENSRAYYCPMHTGVNRTSKPHIPMLKAPSIKESDLLLIVAKKCAEFEKQKQEIRTVIYRMDKIGGIMDRPEQMVVKAKQELEAIEKQRLATFEAHAAGRIDEMEYIIQRGNISDMLKTKEAELEEYVQLKKQMETDLKRVKDILFKDAEELVERIELNGDGTVDVHFREEETIRRIMG